MFDWVLTTLFEKMETQQFGQLLKQKNYFQKKDSGYHVVIFIAKQDLVNIQLVFVVAVAAFVVFVVCDNL